MASAQLLEEHPHPQTDPQGRSSPDFNRPNMSETRIVLVGKTGAGKSSCANTILGRNAFRSAGQVSSVTRECSKDTGVVGDRLVSIVDTPGLFDTFLPDEKVKREIAKCVNMSAPGPHAIVVVIKVGPFTIEEKQTVEKLQEIFGENAEKYTMILFTCGDEIESIEKSLAEANENLRQILQKFGNRYHVFNNTNISDRTQVLELFEKIDEMISVNEVGYYTNPTYVEVVKILAEREEKLKKLFEAQMKEKEIYLVARYEEALKALEKENQNLEKALNKERMEKLKNRKDTDLRETKRYYGALQENALQIIENVPSFDTFETIMQGYSEKLRMNWQ